MATVMRETLYAEVWAEPMLALAKKYQISNVALSKICHKLKVPTPPRGYWARIRHGYRDQKPALPKLTPGNLDRWEIHPTEKTVEQPVEVLDRRVFEKDPANRIVVPTTLRGEIHPLVLATQRFLEDRASWNEKLGCLNLSVSQASRGRALRILNSLVGALEERGMKVEAKWERRCSSSVLVEEERMGLSLEEKNIRVEVPETKRKYSWDPRFESKPTGKLIFRIHSYWPRGVQKSWTDGVRQRLEDQLNEICAAFVTISIGLRKQRQEWERLSALREEEARIRGLEQARKERLSRDLDLWRRAAEIRRMVKELRLRKPHGEFVAEFRRWADWAEKIARSCDPLEKGFRGFLERYPFDARGAGLSEPHCEEDFDEDLESVNS